ncbi:MAG: nitroreductase family protein [Halobacteriales archaeon]
MQHIRERVAEHRTPTHDIDPIFVNRWSPRSMTGDQLDPEEFLPLFEAARWAPSSRNEQPWRFLYATRESDAWETFLSFPYSKNREWASDAAVLVVICSKTTFEYDGSQNGTHAFDTGAAWENLALEGARRGLVVHAMAGFDDEKAARELNVPEEYEVHAMVAIGVHAPDEAPESERPNSRKPLEEILLEGGFSGVDQ